VEANVRRAVPTARVMYIEPDVYRTARADESADEPTDGDETADEGAEIH
jgi:hypothetical protein